MYVKRFLEWIGLKQDLDTLKFKPPYVNEGDIWWVSIGENIGSEISGKSKLFSRPMIVLKKLSHGFYFAIPTSTRKKEGSWYVPLCQKGKIVKACLHQARSVDYRRFSSKLGRLDDEDFAKVKRGFWKLYK